MSEEIIRAIIFGAGFGVGATAAKFYINYRLKALVRELRGTTKDWSTGEKIIVSEP